jgi:DNA-binding response OmpR family regulator
MSKRPAEILLVEDDVELAEMIQDYLAGALPVRVTVAASTSEALREELTHRHDAVIADLELNDGDTLSLIRQLRVSNRCPLVLMAANFTAPDLIEAIRLGVRDVLVKPFAIQEMSDVLGRAIRSRVRHRKTKRRYQRLRLLTARILRERQDLKQRTDLICQDLVNAYRGLAQKVAESGVLTHQ